MLEVSKLQKNFTLGDTEVEVLRDITFCLAAGEAMAVTGPSGSGKSTLLHLLGTLDHPTSGSYRLDGRDPAALSEPELARFRNEHIGFVFQEHRLLPQFSVIENVLLPTFAFPSDRAADRRRAQDLIERVGLGHRRNHRPAELSGGERQRVAVARALIRQPQLLLCDEPTGSLDAATSRAVADLLFELHEQGSRSGEGSQVMIVVTHSEDLASRFARRCRLSEGRCSAD
ncbi:MAG: ABC transporter ATP-binding protein [Acidobacteriota bacterium]